MEPTAKLVYTSSVIISFDILETCKAEQVDLCELQEHVTNLLDTTTTTPTTTTIDTNTIVGLIEASTNSYTTTSDVETIVASKIDVLGLFTVKVVSQFDVKTETGVERLQEGMSVIGLNALNAFLDANRKQPFLHAELKRISEAATAVQRETEQEKAPDLDYPALSP